MISAQRCASERVCLAWLCARVWAGVALLPVTAWAGVQISLHLDAGSVELMRALRRAQGVDAPDLEADRRVAALLWRRQVAKRQSLQSPTAAAPAPAAPASTAQLVTTLLAAAVDAAGASRDAAPVAGAVEPHPDAAASASQDQFQRRPRP